MQQLPGAYVPLRQLKWRWVLAVFAVILVCLFFYRQLEYAAYSERRSPLLTFAEEATGTFAGILVFPLAYLVAVRFPLVRKNWRRNVLVHLIAVCLISVVHTTLIVIARSTLFPFFGLNDSYGYIPVRYPMEFAHFFIFYWVGVSLISLFHEVRFARERELQQAKLETSLAEAQLQNLRLQLEPHFLFNALNAISAAIYESPRAADEMVCRLGDLLRQLLKDDRSQEIPLAREIEILRLYTRIMEARLEHRLKVHIDVEPAAEEALVPQLLLQPLVENAIHHGMDPLTFEVDITITARLRNRQLELLVRDRGPGLRPKRQMTGIGLNNTAQRLLKLYANRHRLEMRNAEDGGAVVEIRIPFHTAAPAEPAAVLEHLRA
jgi:two-component system LytT family sensor kinase